MYPGRAFSALVGGGILLMLLFGAAVLRYLGAGSPASWNDLSCLLLPTKGDVGIHLLSYALIGAVLWGTFSGLASWCRQWISTRRLTRHLASLAVTEGTPELLTSQPKLKGRVYLIDSDAPLCFCAGLLSPRIYISRAMVDELAPEELEALLLHEKYHLESRDPLKVLLGQSLVSALFFVPILRDLYRRYLTSKEIAADRKAIREQGNLRGLAGALAKLVTEGQGGYPEGVGVGAAESVNQRIDHLTGQKGHPWRGSLPRLVASLAILIIIFGALVVPLQSSHPVAGSAQSAAHSCHTAEAGL